MSSQDWVASCTVALLSYIVCSWLDRPIATNYKSVICSRRPI